MQNTLAQQLQQAQNLWQQHTQQTNDPLWYQHQITAVLQKYQTLLTKKSPTANFDWQPYPHLKSLMHQQQLGKAILFFYWRTQLKPPFDIHVIHNHLQRMEQHAAATHRPQIAVTAACYQQQVHQHPKSYYTPAQRQKVSTWLPHLLKNMTFNFTTDPDKLQATAYLTLLGIRAQAISRSEHVVTKFTQDWDQMITNQHLSLMTMTTNLWTQLRHSLTQTIDPAFVTENIHEALQTLDLVLVEPQNTTDQIAIRPWKLTDQPKCDPQTHQWVTWYVK